jgi:hypothetical protein
MRIRVSYETTDDAPIPEEATVEVLDLDHTAEPDGTFRHYRGSYADNGETYLVKRDGMYYRLDSEPDDGYILSRSEIISSATAVRDSVGDYWYAVDGGWICGFDQSREVSEVSDHAVHSALPARVAPYTPVSEADAPDTTCYEDIWDGTASPAYWYRIDGDDRWVCSEGRTEAERLSDNLYLGHTLSYLRAAGYIGAPVDESDL